MLKGPVLDCLLNVIPTSFIETARTPLIEHGRSLIRFLEEQLVLTVTVSERGAKKICVHVLTDGHGVSDGSSVGFAETLEKDLADLRSKVDSHKASSSNIEISHSFGSTEYSSFNTALPTQYSWNGGYTEIQFKQEPAPQFQQPPIEDLEYGRVSAEKYSEAVEKLLSCA